MSSFGNTGQTIDLPIREASVTAPRRSVAFVDGKWVVSNSSSVPRAHPQFVNGKWVVVGSSSREPRQPTQTQVQQPVQPESSPQRQVPSVFGLGDRAPDLTTDELIDESEASNEVPAVTKASTESSYLPVVGSVAQIVATAIDPISIVAGALTGKVNMAVTLDSMHTPGTRALALKGYIYPWNVNIANFFKSIATKHVEQFGALPLTSFSLRKLEEIVREIDDVISPTSRLFENFTKAEFGLFMNRTDKLYYFAGPISQLNHLRGGMRGGSNKRIKAGAYWGISQFSVATWNYMKPLAASAGYILPDREMSTPVDQLVALYIYVVKNQAELIKYGLPVTVANLYGSHNQGSAGFRKYLETGVTLGHQGKPGQTHGANLLATARNNYRKGSYRLS